MAEPTVGRPQVPAGYRIEPGAAGLIPWQSVVERLADARNYWIATTSPDGRPHAAPVWGLWLEGAFYFSTDPASRKGRNLASSPELEVHLESGDDVVILEGMAEPVIDRAVLARFVDAYDAKYGFRPEPGHPAQGFYRLRPRVGFAWYEKDFPQSSTRFVF